MPITRSLFATLLVTATLLTPAQAGAWGLADNPNLARTWPPSKKLFPPTAALQNISCTDAKLVAWGFPGSGSVPLDARSMIFSDCSASGLAQHTGDRFYLSLSASGGAHYGDDAGYHQTSFGANALLQVTDDAIVGEATFLLDGEAVYILAQASGAAPIDRPLPAEEWRDYWLADSARRSVDLYGNLHWRYDYWVTLTANLGVQATMTAADLHARHTMKIEGTYVATSYKAWPGNETHSGPLTVTRGGVEGHVNARLEATGDLARVCTSADFVDRQDSPHPWGPFPAAPMHDAECSDWVRYW